MGKDAELSSDSISMVTYYFLSLRFFDLRLYHNSQGGCVVVLHVLFLNFIKHPTVEKLTYTRAMDKVHGKAQFDSADVVEAL